MIDKSQLEHPRTGLRALKAAVNLRGMGAISGRTAPGRALVAWRRELVAALGGEATVSPQRMALVETCVRTRLLLEHVDAHILALGSLVTGGAGSSRSWSSATA